MSNEIKINLSFNLPPFSRVQSQQLLLNLSCPNIRKWMKSLWSELRFFDRHMLFNAFWGLQLQNSVKQTFLDNYRNLCW
ncbi:CLUMA_CG020460, isoform A [Clunio marinus]|uniref:CLUMA_CG020460, isoform A n=1 Tax=Clunio marinus TaxID=568069 RepID=A0A1J1J511_9DIPT|nr:CLUMA_CG020460, isoform A [Clunio marinus]